jgi:hypothetical protein
VQTPHGSVDDWAQSNTTISTSFIEGEVVMQASAVFDPAHRITATTNHTARLPLEDTPVLCPDHIHLTHGLNIYLD